MAFPENVGSPPAVEHGAPGRFARPGSRNSWILRVPVAGATRLQGACAASCARDGCASTDLPAGSLLPMAGFDPPSDGGYLGRVRHSMPPIHSYPYRIPLLLPHTRHSRQKSHPRMHERAHKPQPVRPEPFDTITTGAGDQCAHRHAVRPQGSPQLCCLAHPPSPVCTDRQRGYARPQGSDVLRCSLLGLRSHASDRRALPLQG